MRYSMKNMCKKKKGFTLIELLAVIVILAIIALIASPIIIGLIDDARKESIRSSSYGILSSAEKGFAKTLLNKNGATTTQYKYENGEETKIQGNIELKYNGKKPQNGIIFIDKTGKVEIAFYENGVCATKGYNDSEVTLSEVSIEECTPPSVPRVVAESCFTFNSTTGTITGYNNTCPKNPIIPSTIAGVPVTSIGSYAFNDKKLTSVKISNGIKFIGDWSFFVNELTSLEIPISVTSINLGAFAKNKLESVTIPDSVTSIGDSGFSYNKLTSLTIPSSVTNISYAAFTGNQLPDDNALYIKEIVEEQKIKLL